MSNGRMRTELSVTLSYLPRGELIIGLVLEMNLLLQDFAKSGIIQLDIRA